MEPHREDDLNERLFLLGLQLLLERKRYLLNAIPIQRMPEVTPQPSNPLMRYPASSKVLLEFGKQYAFLREKQCRNSNLSI